MAPTQRFRMRVERIAFLNFAAYPIERH